MVKYVDKYIPSKSTLKARATTAKAWEVWFPDLLALVSAAYQKQLPKQHSALAPEDGRLPVFE